MCGTKTRLKDDSGIALLSVVLVSSIIFLLVTTVLILMAYRTTQTTQYVERNQAMHLADAGLNEYMYRLSANGYDYWKSNPTIGPLALEGGTWVVTAEKAGEQIRLRSQGTLDNGKRRTITALVRFPTFADYAWVLGSGNITFGATTVVNGKVRVTGNIYNSGVIKATAYACGTGKRCYTGSSSTPKTANYPGGWQDGATPPDFSKITTDINKLKNTASGENSYFPPTGKEGYRVTLQGSQVRIEQVTKVEETSGTILGQLSVTATQTVAVPASGVLFFDDYVWPMGSYSTPVTLATSKDMIYTQNLLRDPAHPKAVCGLVSVGKATWPVWYVSMPQNLTVEAAILSQSGTIGYDATYPSTAQNPRPDRRKNDLVLRGSLSAAGGNTGFYASDLSSGFIGDRLYTYDPALYDDPPPLFPVLQGDNLRVTQWIDQ